MTAAGKARGGPDVMTASRRVVRTFAWRERPVWSDCQFLTGWERRTTAAGTCGRCLGHYLGHTGRACRCCCMMAPWLPRQQAVHLVAIGGLLPLHSAAGWPAARSAVGLAPDRGRQPLGRQGAPVSSEPGVNSEACGAWALAGPLQVFSHVLTPGLFTVCLSACLCPSRGVGDLGAAHRHAEG